MDKETELVWPEQKEFQLKSLSIGAKSFTANGVEYFIEEKISFSRWNIYEELELSVAYGATVRKLWDGRGEVHDLLNEQRLADAIVVNHNLQVGLEGLLDPARINLGVRMCALVINRKDEDRRYINEQMIRVKARDWEVEGFDMFSFFGLAVNSIKDCIALYNSIIHATSQTKQESNEKNG